MSDTEDHDNLRILNNSASIPMLLLGASNSLPR